MGATNAVAVDSVRDDALSLEALLLSRSYLYALFYKAFGGQPTAEFIDILSSDETLDALDEYSGESTTLSELGRALRAMRDETDVDLLWRLEAEFTRWFEGPGDLPAAPYQSPYVSGKPALFQVSTLAVRKAFEAGGYRIRRFKRVPDDDVSAMCLFLFKPSERTLRAFRLGDGDAAISLLERQREFLSTHMNNWLPMYAGKADRAGDGELYPLLIKSACTFARIDQNFTVQAKAWVGGESDISCLAGLERPESFDLLEARLSSLTKLQMLGLDDVELVEI